MGEPGGSTNAFLQAVRLESDAQTRAYAQITNDGRIEDGGGLLSSADWLRVTTERDDPLWSLREEFRGLVKEWGLEKRVREGFVKDGPGMFSEGEVEQIRNIGVKFLSSKGFQTSKKVVPGQPFALDIMESLLSLCEDGDSVLPSILRKGIPTGVNKPIEPCSLYEVEERGCKLRECDEDIRICLENWKSADDNVDKVEALLREEIRQGWVERWDGDLHDAQKRWGDKVAVGKLALISTHGKDDRLIGDSSAPGVSGRARFPNRMRHPKPSDVEEALTRCAEQGGDWAAITVDVKAAHKTMRVSEEDAGLCFFRIAGVLYRYLTCHFGASYSAFWWGRVSGALIRLLHLFFGAGHSAMTYVDDTLVLVRAHTALSVASLVALFMTMVGVPLSWHKFKIGTRICFIGFVIGLGQFTLGLETEKLEKIIAFLRSLKKGCRHDKHALVKGVGVLLWASAILPWLRPRLAEFYNLINRPGLVWQKLPVSLMTQVFQNLDSFGVLQQRVPGVVFNQGLCLGYVGKHKVRSGESWAGWVSRAPGCLGFLDWDARRVRINSDVVEAARLWEKGLLGGDVVRWCARKHWADGDAAADAMATGESASLGGWWVESGGKNWSAVHWFRLSLSPADLAPWVQIKGDWGHDIVFFEAMAQVILLMLRTEGNAQRGSKLHQWCDNETTVMAVRKGLSTATPLCWALQAWEHWKKVRDVEASGVILR